MDTRKVYSQLAQTVQAYHNSAKLIPSTRNPGEVEPRSTEWIHKHGETICQIVRDLLPSGAGIDSGTRIDLDASHVAKLVFTCGYHHMNDGGYYDGWTEHTVTVTPSFSGLNIRISGRNRNDIKEHLYETFDYALTRDIVWNETDARWMDTRYLKPAVQS